MITSLYLSIFMLLFCVMSIRVIACRKNNKIAVGDGNNDQLRLLIRSHSNFAEYVPIFLLGVFVMEMCNVKHFILHALCLIFLLGRVLHLYSVTFCEKYKNGKCIKGSPIRVYAMMITFCCLIVCSFLMLFVYFCKPLSLLVTL